MTVKYRPEIDGLRAIAVLAVVLYHAELTFFDINPFQGGYLGVDIFFVISGYLITSIILTDLKENKFSLLAFYQRRMRRILPALFTVMLVSIPFAWMYMIPKALKEYAGSVLYSLLFSSNLWFFNEDSYRAQASTLKPFLHTWSLSVEEQFYLLYPITLILIWKFATKYIFVFLLLIGIGSLILAESNIATAPDFAFYLLPTRAWELIAGALLVFGGTNQSKLSNDITDRVFSGLGVLLILSSIILFTDNTEHPSLITLIPILGTMLIIQYSKMGSFVTNILTSKFLVKLGLISYGFYLWHYPVFAFFRITGDNHSHFDKIGWIALSITLATVSYHFVEQPLRKEQFCSKKLFFSIISMAFLLLITIQYSIYLNDGVPSRMPYSKDIWETFRESDYRSICVAPGGEEELFQKRWCQIGDEKTQPSFLLLGDSHANAMMELLHSMGKQRGESGLFLFQSGCPPLIGVYPNRKKADSDKCYQLNDEALQLASSLSIKNVILVARWNYYLNPLGDKVHQNINTFYGDFSPQRSSEVFVSQLTKTLRAYEKFGVTTTIMLQVPHQKETPEEAYSKLYPSNFDVSRSDIIEAFKLKSLNISDHKKELKWQQK